jgi:hypothetical protein
MQPKALILVSLLAFLGTQGSVCAALCLASAGSMHGSAPAPAGSVAEGGHCGEHGAPEPPAGSHSEPGRNCDDSCPGFEAMAAAVSTPPGPASLAAPAAGLVHVASHESIRLHTALRLTAPYSRERPPPRQLLYRKSSLLL